MNKTLAKATINLYAIVFIASGLAAIFVYWKIVAGAFVFIWAGIALLRRRMFGVYAVFLVALVLASLGLFFVWLAIQDIMHRLYRFDILLMGLAPIVFALLTLYLFTRRQVAEEFGVERIAILEKVDKKEIIAAGSVLLWIAGIVGGVLLACYLVVRLIAR